LKEHPLRRLLSRIIRSEDAANVELAYVHRGAPEDTLKIKATEIQHVAKGSILLSDMETQIPFHRILYVRDEKQKLTLWTKRGRT
jgi:uncharacterized protein (UPF0248 family)